MTESNRKNAEKIVGRQYVVVEEGKMFPLGTVVTLTYDDGSDSPEFADDAGTEWFVRMKDVLLLAETEEPTEAAETPVAEKIEEEPKVAEHKYAVGQKVKIVGTDEENCFTMRTGENAIVTAHEAWTGDNHTENGTPFYKVVLGDGVRQALTEYQLEPVDPFITEEQYQALEIGDTVIIRNDLEVGKRYGGNVFARSMVKHLGKQLTVRGDLGHPAGIVVKEAEYSWTRQMIAAVIKKETIETDPEFDSPELIEGEIYVAKLYGSDLWIYRYKKGDNAVSHSICLCVGSDYVGLHGTITHSTFEYRKATLDEAEQLIKEEQKRGIKYQQFTESVEVEPEVGQFYSAKKGENPIVLVKIGSDVQNSWGHTVIFTEHDSYFFKGFLTVDKYNYTPATDKQKIQLLKAMADHGDATEADLDLLSELMPLDNPELEVGAIYFVKTAENWLVRSDGEKKTEKQMETCFAMTPSDNYTSGSGGCISARKYRKALPHEVAKLEAAEKEHGCVYH